MIKSPMLIRLHDRALLALVEQDSALHRHHLIHTIEHGKVMPGNCASTMCGKQFCKRCGTRDPEIYIIFCDPMWPAPHGEDPQSVCCALLGRKPLECIHAGFLKHGSYPLLSLKICKVARFDEQCH